jgi:integrase
MAGRICQWQHSRHGDLLPLSVLLLLMVRHGLRVSEACRLKLDQVDTESRVLHVARLKRGLHLRDASERAESDADQPRRDRNHGGGNSQVRHSRIGVGPEVDHYQNRAVGGIAD